MEIYTKHKVERFPRPKSYIQVLYTKTLLSMEVGDKLEATYKQAQGFRSAQTFLRTKKHPNKYKLTIHYTVERIK